MYGVRASLGCHGLPLLFLVTDFAYAGGSRFSRIFWEHENLSGLSVIRLISTDLH